MAEWRINDAVDTEQYDDIAETAFRSPLRAPLSTFSIDVDTAAYSNVRRFLRDGRLPPAGAVRIEELINYFDYAYPSARGGEPFSITTELATAPWNERHQLLLVGLQGRVLEERDVPPRNLVFLLDVSGSMQSLDKLPLLKRALRGLVSQLRPEDHVAIVVYAGSSGVVLTPTPGSDAPRIQEALAKLEAGGSTHGSQGIRRAYELAREHFDPSAINRVILATDGDFNVGTTSRSELVKLIEGEREHGIFLTVLGVGTGNLKDATMEELADHGNGNYAYLDGIAEARKVLVQQAGGTLVTIAKDVKLQIEFNPALVAGYRLIGYENRRLEDRDFNDDTKDAGEIGAGHDVTALYEIVPVGVEVDTGGVDPLRYQDDPGGASTPGPSGELAWVKIRYKTPDGDASRKLEHSVASGAHPIAQASETLRFCSAVALFGMLLRDSELRGDGSFDTVRALARDSLGRDEHGYRAEFVSLVARASELRREAGAPLAKSH
jgi:Ca-activated chloride channel family protein